MIPGAGEPIRVLGVEDRGFTPHAYRGRVRHAG